MGEGGGGRAKGSAARKGRGETTEGYDGGLQAPAQVVTAKETMRYISQKLVIFVFWMTPLRPFSNQCQLPLGCVHVQ